MTAEAILRVTASAARAEKRNGGAAYRDVTDLSALRAACVDVFAARARDAEALGLTVRTWPPTVRAYADWQTDFADAAGDTELTLDAAVDHVNEWIRQIRAASTP